MKFTILTVAAALSSASAFTTAVSERKRKMRLIEVLFEKSLANVVFPNNSLFFTDPFHSPRILVNRVL
jgi:hypothetical protein